MRGLLIIALLVGTLAGTAQEIKWYSWEEAMELQKKSPKKIFVDVYTDWCGWCKRMDKGTFMDKSVAEEMNKYYYAVKFDAERKEDVVFNGKTYVNPRPDNRKSTHDFARFLLNNKLSYPTVVVLDEKLMSYGPIPGYRAAADMKPILVYLGSEAFKTEPVYANYLAAYKKKQAALQKQ